MLKALLTNANINIKKTHDIEELIEICTENNIDFIPYIDLFIKLNEYAVEGRYGIICDDLDDTENYIDNLKLLIELTTRKLK